MIINENILINDIEFVKTYSDANFKIERDGVLYDEAFDLAILNRVYIESEIPITQSIVIG